MPVAGDAERSLPNAWRTVTRSAEGNKIALKHGRYAADQMTRRQNISALVRLMKSLAKPAK